MYMSKKEFPNFIDLLSSTWQRYRLQFNGLVGASLFAIIGMLILVIFCATFLIPIGVSWANILNSESIGYGIIIPVAVAGLILYAFFAYMTIIMQKIALSKKKVSVRALMNTTSFRELGRSMATIIIVYTSIFLGGMAFLIPGLIFLTLSVIAWPIMIDKKAGGVLVFAYAYHYIKNQLSGYLLSTIVFWIISIILCMLVGPLLTIAWIILYTPFQIVFATILYEEVHGGRDLIISKRSRAKWGLISMIIISFGAFVIFSLINFAANFISNNPNIDVIIDSHGMSFEYNEPLNMNNQEVKREINPDSKNEDDSQ